MFNRFAIAFDSCHKSRSPRQKGSMSSRLSRFLVTAALMAAFSFAAPKQAAALSVKDWKAQPRQQQSYYVADFIARFTGEIAKTNPTVSQAIHDWFYVVPQGHAVSDGIIHFEAEIGALNDWAKEGKADLSKIQIEASSSRSSRTSSSQSSRPTRRNSGAGKPARFSDNRQHAQLLPL